MPTPCNGGSFQDWFHDDDRSCNANGNPFACIVIRNRATGYVVHDHKGHALDKSVGEATLKLAGPPVRPGPLDLVSCGPRVGRRARRA
jgi:hypothetical protein